MKVLFSNPPWHVVSKDGNPAWRGVRAGSRWPHTFEYSGYSEQNGHVPELVRGYMPFPFWLATASAYAEKMGFEVDARDSIALGETYDNFYTHVVDFKPDVVVIESATATIKHDLEVVRNLREKLGTLIVVFTGLHVEMEDPNFLISNPELDYTIYGEYEDSVIRLLIALRDGSSVKNIPNLVYREDLAGAKKNEFGELKPLDEYPWPYRGDGIPALGYFDGVCGLPAPQLQLMATRGCPYGCIFCVWPQMLYRGGKYRKRTASDIVDEIEYNFQKHPFKSYYIDDDTFNINRKFVIEIATLIKERGLSHIPWGTMGRADLIDEEQLEALKAAGLFSIKYGVESSDQQILDEADKRIDINRVIDGIRLTKKYGIKVHLTFTFGLPSDTVETIENTIDLACNLPCDTAQFSIATPYPGTKMYTLYKNNGWLDSNEWDNYVGSTTAVSRTKNFKPEQLEYYVKEAYRRFYATQDRRALEEKGFSSKLREIVGSQVAPGASIVVVQSARVSLTSFLAYLLVGMGYKVNVLTHKRFADEFTSIVGSDSILDFDAPYDFDYSKMSGLISALNERDEFAGVIMPVSHEDGEGYEQVELVSRSLGPLLAKVNLKGEFLDIGRKASEQREAMALR